VIIVISSELGAARGSDPSPKESSSPASNVIISAATCVDSIREMNVRAKTVLVCVVSIENITNLLCVYTLSAFGAYNDWPLLLSDKPPV
jgi:hypothetical protein